MRGYLRFALLGLVIIVGVVGWQLMRSTYKSDLYIMCNAEESSGLSVRDSSSKVSAWIVAHLSTPEGTTFWNRIAKEPAPARAYALREAAAGKNIARCPLVDSLQALDADEQYRADVVRLCNSTGEIKNIIYLDEATRAAKLAQWAPRRLKTQQGKDLAQKIVTAPLEDRRKIMSDAAFTAQYFQCALAEVIAVPPAPPEQKTAVVTFDQPVIAGAVASIPGVAMALGGRIPEIRECYVKALAGHPGLEGQLVMKVGDTAAGKAENLAVQGAVFDKGLSDCASHVVASLDLPPPKVPDTTITFTFHFVPVVTVTPVSPDLPPAADAPDGGAPPEPTDAAAHD